MFIDGKWADPAQGRTFEVLNPADGSVIAGVPDGGKKAALEAVDAAHRAFPLWSQTTAYQRADHLHRLHSLIMENREHLARTMTEEQGKPLAAARNEVRYGADFLLWFAEEAKRVYGRTIPAPRADQRFLVLKQPVGVVAAITPWNYPVSMITRKMAPALAAGCTLVIKPAEETPLCAVEIMKLAEQAGIPAGVVNLVTAGDPAPIGEVFTSDPRIAKLTFTGSTEVGRRLAAKAAGNLKRISLELGGHAPFIVCEDADPVKAAKGLSLVKFLNTGQACICPNRIFVHKSRKEAFLKVLCERVAGMKAGKGTLPGISIGPLVNQAAMDKVRLQVEDALARGARLAAGGGRLTEGELEKGWFFAPTVLEGVTEDMRIFREETFGPVAPVITYEDEDELIERANDTNYGLAAYIYTDRISRAMTLFEQLNFGIIGINDINPTAAAAPFGGMKESGLGREGGYEGIDEYLEVKLGGLSLR